MRPGCTLSHSQMVAPPASWRGSPTDHAFVFDASGVNDGIEAAHIHALERPDKAAVPPKSGLDRTIDHLRRHCARDEARLQTQQGRLSEGEPALHIHPKRQTHSIAIRRYATRTAACAAPRRLLDS